MGRLGDDIYRLRRQIRQWQDDRSALAEDIKTDRQRIQHDVAALQAEFRRQHVSKTRRIRIDLQDHRRKITAEVAELKKATARWRAELPDLSGPWQRMRKQIRDQMTESARKGATDRSAYVSGIRQHVGGLHEEFSRFRKTIIQDIDDLRRAWHGEGAETEESFSERVAMDAAEQLSQTIEEIYIDDTIDDTIDDSAPPPSHGEERETQDAADTPDDLTMIAGIGPERQKQLNAAGIFTFRYLSGQTADQIQAQLDKGVSAEDVQRWIDQARELTSIG